MITTFMEFSVGDRFISISYVAVSFLIGLLFSPENDRLASGYDFGTLEIRGNVQGGKEEELCSNDVTAIVGETVRLTFPTTKKDSIQLEHRTVDRSYPLHVFKDGKLVNDYYVLSGRYGFSPSNNGSWILIIKDVHASDAGSFICREDNGLGQQYAKELVVIRENGVSCSTEKETCADEFNVTCKATYTGNCAPRLLLSTEGGTPRINEDRLIITGNSVSLMTVADRTHVPVCEVATQSMLLKSTCQMPVCKGTTIGHEHSIGIVVISITIVIAICIITASVIRNRRGSPHQRCRMERNAVPGEEHHEESREMLRMINGPLSLPNL